MSDKKKYNLKTISDFAKRKGFLYQGSEIYGGLANTWDYGPKGVLLKDNIKRLWKEHFVYQRTDMVELDAGIFMNQKVWEASGHVGGFADCLIDDKTTKHRFRVDHLIEEQYGVDVEGWSPQKITDFIREKGLLNPNTNKPGDWTEARYMNLMFESNRDKLSNSISILEELLEKNEGNSINLDQKDIENLNRKLENQKDGRIYLRPETAQGIFVNFKNILQTERARLPFGIAQIGKAFRNEITPGNFNFRVVEFEQMEIEYFINPPQVDSNPNDTFNEFLESQKSYLQDKLGFESSSIRLKEHSQEKLSHYSKRTVDIEYDFPFGFSELTGLAYRTDFDLKQHQEHSGQSMEYTDPHTGVKVLPHCFEPTVGVDRLVLACLTEAYTEEVLESGDTRIVNRFAYEVAPIKVAVLPLMKKGGMSEYAFNLYKKLRSQNISCEYDESGSIGKRYRRQDENGTPWCVCVDFDTIDDDTITLRHRDNMTQIRIPVEKIEEYLNKQNFGF